MEKLLSMLTKTLDYLHRLTFLIIEEPMIESSTADTQYQSRINKNRRKRFKA